MLRWYVSDNLKPVIIVSNITIKLLIAMQTSIHQKEFKQNAL